MYKVPYNFNALRFLLLLHFYLINATALSTFDGSREVILKTM